MTRLALYLLGQPRVELDGEPVPLSRRKALALLVYLAATGNSYTRDALATLFWPEHSQSKARASLRGALSSLKKALGSGWLEADRESVGLNPTAEIWLDMVAFQDRLAECRTHGHPPDQACPDCLSLLTEAAALYQDDFLAGFTLWDSAAFDEWQFFQAEALRNALASGLERLAQGHCAQGKYETAVLHARRWVSLDPLNEPAQRVLMQLYALSGQRGAALRQYAECQRALEEALGAPPAAETAALYEQIVAGEQEVPAPRVKTVRGYELRERIGSGGFGEVYRAYQPFVARDVAVKVILPQFARHPEFVRRFEAEAQLVARLEHPHIVPLYDYWREPEGAYLVMRWLQGGNLADALQRGPWHPQGAAQLLDQIAGALDVAHRQGVVHRDIKPENILLDRDDNAYLSDFGIAKILTVPRRGKDLTHAATTTAPGAVPGSLWYISPEQAQSGPVTPQSDLYSLGIVLYEVLSGEHPFAGLTPADQLVRRLTQPLPPLCERRPDLPAALEGVIQRATANDPADRFPDTPSFARAFRAALSSTVTEIAAPPASARTHNLPAQLTLFVGREREMADVQRLLGTTRLLTLTGPPGTGKTRLGLQVAGEVLDRFADGVFFVDLAPISDPLLVASTIAQVLGVSDTGGQPLVETLENYLRAKRLLLLLDNFEQIVGAAPLVGDLLSASPGLRALVTSREALHVYGEQEYPVPPLALPDLGRSEPLRDLSQYEAVELFVQRARAVRPDFTLTKEDAPAIAEICVRLDGLPLAIELAAARSRLLTPHMMCQRLESRLGTLTGGARDLPARMRTLRGAIDWSYDLLDPAEKSLFARLAVFQGGRTLEAVEVVCLHDLDIDVIDGLESLVHKSLLRQEQGLDGEPRFFLLETIHEYAQERLEESGEAETMQQRHAGYFVALAECAEPELHGARQDDWSARLSVEHNNLRTALAWSLGDVPSGDAEIGLRLVGALRDFWYYRGHIGEGVRWAERALERLGGAPLALRAKALNAAGTLAFAQGDYERGSLLHREALALSRGAGDSVNQAWALVFLGADLSAYPDQYDEGLALCEEGLALFRALDDKPGMMRALNILGELARLDGDYERAEKAYEECLAVSRETGNRQRETIMLGNLGYVAQHQGDYERAESFARQYLARSWEYGWRYSIPAALSGLAGPAAARGDPERAARVLGAAEAFLETLGVGLQPADQAEADRFAAVAREQLDEVTFEAAWAEGRAMSLEQAVAYALG